MEQMKSSMFFYDSRPAYLAGGLDARRCPSLELIVYIRETEDWWYDMAIFFSEGYIRVYENTNSCIGGDVVESIEASDLIENIDDAEEPSAVCAILVHRLIECSEKFGHLKPEDVPATEAYINHACNFERTTELCSVDLIKHVRLAYKNLISDFI